MEALTVYPEPRYRPIVLALAGDSTITSFPRPVGVRVEPAVARLPDFVFPVVLEGDRFVVARDRGFVVPVVVSVIDVSIPCWHIR
jgi:hypothetical protein